MNEEFFVRVPWGTFGPGGEWSANNLLEMPAAEQYRQNVESGYLPADQRSSSMTRIDYDRKEALTPGTWQNRQGRDDEWTPAPDAHVGFALCALSVALVIGAAVVAMVLA